MKTFMAVIAAILIIFLLNVIGAILFGWQRGGGAIPQLCIAWLALWVFFVVKKKLNTTNQEE